MRARDLGLAIGEGRPGPLNAITDVAGVRVGHATIAEGEAVRTGVTVVIPAEGDPAAEPVLAGYHCLNGYGELIGAEWVRESGLLTAPVALTNTYSAGVVRDAIVAAGLVRGERRSRWPHPVVGETNDGVLSDIEGMHVRSHHVLEALASARGGPVAEGCVGAGTGTVAFGFKGGIGTASRVLPAAEGGWTLGVLVQANHGRRARFCVDGVPVGLELGPDVVPLPPPPPGRGGSVVVLVATDAPLLPHQCTRLAHRAALGVARTGGAGEDGSGDFFLAWSTGNRVQAGPGGVAGVRMLTGGRIDPLFHAVIEAVEEATVNALLAAETTSGKDGAVAYRLDPGLLAQVLARYQPGPQD